MSKVKLLSLLLFFEIPILLSLLLVNLPFSASNETPSQLQILVDQFGYRPSDQKIAVIRQDGKNPNRLGELTSQNFQIQNAETGDVVYSAKPRQWSNGVVHSQSGDYASLLDFSKVNIPGRYLISSVEGLRSSTFTISENVYRDALVAAVRMYFYQRSGFPKKEPYADSKWQDDAAFLGPGQDTEARFVEDKNNAALARDMRGGWFDAGDTNKYVTFAAPAVHQLLDAYSQNPKIWTDDFNIPESGNNIPDLIDELRYELDWLQRMQDDDGGVFIKIGALDFNFAIRPSLDKRSRFYGPKCSSATISAAGIFAHAAIVLRNVSGYGGYADTLQTRAIRAWNWFKVHPIGTDCDTQEIKSGDADVSYEGQIGDAITASVYLSLLTSQDQYTDYLKNHLTESRPFSDNVWSRYSSYQGDALLFYATLTKADDELRHRILERFEEVTTANSEIYGSSFQRDPYGAYMPNEQYHWGSNAVKANDGNSNYDLVLYNLALDKKLYQERALSSLHYLHGVNPLGIVYLTNMYSYGVEHSANEMYHEWFGKGAYSNALTSPSGPAPGYLTGGPNQDYTGSAPLQKELPMRAYLDSNDSKLNMWEITEPSIGYQSAYVKLLSKFVK